MRSETSFRSIRKTNNGPSIAQAHKGNVTPGPFYLYSAYWTWQKRHRIFVLLESFVHGSFPRAPAHCLYSNRAIELCRAETSSSHETCGRAFFSCCLLSVLSVAIRARLLALPDRPCRPSSPQYASTCSVRERRVSIERKDFFLPHCFPSLATTELG